MTETNNLLNVNTPPRVWWARGFAGKPGMGVEGCGIGPRTQGLGLSSSFVITVFGRN